MVWFLYFSVYPHHEEYEKFGIFVGLRLRHHLLVRNLAKKYEIPALAGLAKESFIKAFKKDWNISIFYDCIPLIYGEQPEPDSALRKFAAQEMKLNLEWDAQRSNLWDDFQHYIQNLPLFASDVLAAVYEKPIQEPSITPNRISKGSWDVEPSRSTFNLPPKPCSIGLVKRSLGHTPILLDKNGRRYDAALFQTKARELKNTCCCLRIVKIYHMVQAKVYYVTHFRYGNVGELETKQALGRDAERLLGEFDRATEYLSDAIEVFEGKFWDLTGLDWANRSDQPKKNEYTYIGESRNGVLSGWDNAVSKPL